MLLHQRAALQCSGLFFFFQFLTPSFIYSSEIKMPSSPNGLSCPFISQWETNSAQQVHTHQHPSWRSLGCPKENCSTECVRWAVQNIMYHHNFTYSISTKSQAECCHFLFFKWRSLALVRLHTDCFDCIQISYRNFYFLRWRSRSRTESRELHLAEHHHYSFLLPISRSSLMFVSNPPPPF